MSPENGNYVTRAELKAHLDPMKSDIHEIHGDVKTLLLAHAGDVALEAKVKDGFARKSSLGMLVLYVISAGTAIANYFHAIRF